MKFIKVSVLALALFVSTASIARGVEEICHEFVAADLEVKQLLQANSNGLENMLRSIDKEKNPKLKSIMRERVFWTYNRLDLPEDTFRRLAFLRCFVIMQ